MHGALDAIVGGWQMAPTWTITSGLPVLSAHVAGNAELFPQIMALHVPPGAVVADVTFGGGVFWKRVPPGRYRLLPTDLATGTDCRALPYADGSVDALVLDPPYMNGLLLGTAAIGTGRSSRPAGPTCR